MLMTYDMLIVRLIYFFKDDNFIYQEFSMITFIAKLYNTPPFTWSMFVLASIANKDRRICRSYSF